MFLCLTYKEKGNGTDTETRLQRKNDSISFTNIFIEFEKSFFSFCKTYASTTTTIRIMIITTQSPAPTFSLSDQDNSIHSLEDYAGKWLVLYFYPKDDTPGCTTEACSFRDSTTIFKEKGVEVIGMSTDSVASHKKFAEKYHLTFPLLADTEKKTVKDYGVWVKKSMYGKEYEGIARTTFLIDPAGVIAHIYENVKPEEHVAQILKDIAF